MKKILVVDDDRGQVQLLEKKLTENGYQVLATDDAAMGLQMAMDKFPDLIVLDVMMPIINGYNFCKLLKAHQKKKKSVVVFLTSRDEKEDIKIGKETGGDAYLTKPVDINELLETIKSLVHA